MRLRRLATPDRGAVLLLIALWLLFFWRLFTPIEADQASLKKGDFSGQFVAFGAYQYVRLAAGEVPLWNPYNNGGLPFIADTQAAVFYPPRLVTIGLSKLAGGWTYHALELEMTAHVLACSLLMYALARRMTLRSSGSVLGALVAAVIAAYGGFLTSYPPLQLALLEAAIWLPLATLGILEATRGERVRWTWLVLSGLALGLSWMAGHPQTSWFLTYLLVAYFGYRVYERRYRWMTFAVGILLIGLISGGLAAVQLLPGVEYLAHTARTGMAFDDKGNGFPFKDVAQFLFPGLVSQWSPLFVGIPGLVLALLAVYRRLPGSLFWGIVAVVGLGLSFGANSPVFALLYNTLPGMRFFRGQERVAYLISFSMAILAAKGMAHLIEWDPVQWPNATRNIRRATAALFGLTGAAVLIVFNEWINDPTLLDRTLSIVIFSAAIAGVTLLLMWDMLAKPGIRLPHGLLVGLLIFELFTVNMDNRFNYDPVPPDEQLSMTPPPLIAEALKDGDIPFRVDGYRVLNDNYGSLYGLADMRGISPLFLAEPYAIIEPDLINPRAWELFAVRYVYTDWNEIPVPSEIIASGEDRYGTVNMHELTDPRPFAHLVYRVQVVEKNAEALTMLRDTHFDPRQTIILNREPGINLSNDASGDAAVQVTAFAPEQFMVEVDTPTDAILSLAHPDYPGWQATLDGESTDIMRAYGALAAVAVPAGNHTVMLRYDPLSYRVGSIFSLITWSALLVMGVWLLAGSRRRNARG